MNDPMPMERRSPPTTIARRRRGAPDRCIERVRAGRRTRVAHVVLALLAPIAWGCTSSEIPGTYEVEIELVRGGRPIEGTLVLSRGVLDVPAPSQEDRALLGEWIDDDAIDANSCFMLHGSGGAAAAPRSVHLIGVRFRDDGIAVPLVIYATPGQSLEVTRLEFFANALGGEVVLHDGTESIAGRIHGSRIGPPARGRCVETLLSLRAGLRDALTP